MFEQHTGGNAFEKVDRQPHQVAESFHRRRNIDLVGGEEQEIAAQIFEEAVEQYRTQDADTEDIERIVSLVDQNFINNDLEEQRDDQREYLQHDHHESDLTEDSFILDELRDEPAKAERLIFIGKFVDLFQQDELAGKLIFKLFLREEDEVIGRIEVVGFRINDHGIKHFGVVFLGTETAENSIFAAFFGGDAGEYCA